MYKIIKILKIFEHFLYEISNNFKTFNNFQVVLIETRYADIIEIKRHISSILRNIKKLPNVSKSKLSKLNYIDSSFGLEIFLISSIFKYTVRTLSPYDSLIKASGRLIELLSRIKILREDIEVENRVGVRPAGDVTVSETRTCLEKGDLSQKSDSHCFIRRRSRDGGLH